MKKLVCLALLVLVALFISVAFADEAAAPDGIPAVVHSNTLSLREAPKTSARRIENLKHDDFVVIPDNSKRIWANDYEFVYVWHDGNYGWVMSKLLTEDPRYLVSADKSPKLYVSPTMRVELTDHLDPEETLLIMEELEHGVVVNFRGGAGFVAYGENTYRYARVGDDEYYYLDKRWGLLEEEEELYAVPDDETEPVAICEEGQVLSIIGESNGFYRIELGKNWLYIEKDDVKLQ